MNAEPEQVKVKIRTIPLVLPVHIDMDTTVLLAQQVEDRLKRIEKDSGTVDTQRFAIQAAYEFAAEIYDLKARNEKDERDLVKALEQIATHLKKMEERFQLDMLPEGEEE